MTARELLQELFYSVDDVDVSGGKDAVETFLSAKEAARAYLAQPVAQPVGDARKVVPREPDGYAHEYPSYHGKVIRFDGGSEYNGSKPLRAIPYWLGEPPADPAAQAEPQPVAQEPRKRCNTCGQPMPVNESPEAYGERMGYLLNESALRDPPTRRLDAAPAQAEPRAWLYTSAHQEPYLSLDRCDPIEGETETPLYAAHVAQSEPRDSAQVVELKRLLLRHLDAMPRLDNDLAEDTRAALAEPFGVNCDGCGKPMKEHDALARCPPAPAAQAEPRLTAKQMRQLTERGHDPAEIAAGRPLAAQAEPREPTPQEIIDAAGICLGCETLGPKCPKHAAPSARGGPASCKLEPRPDASFDPQDGLLAKMKRLRDAIDALEGEEIAYGDAIKLADAGRIARDFIRYNEAHDD